MQKVVFISTASNISGATLALLEIMEELRNRGIQCVCITAERGELEKRLKQKGFKYYKARYASWLCREGELSSITGKAKYYVKKMFECYSEAVISNVLKKEKPDIVHINTGISPVGIKSAKKNGIPVVWQLREDPWKSWNRRPYSLEYEKKCKQSVEKLLAISKYIYGINEKISPDNITWMYDGVDLNGYEGLRKKEIFSDDIIKLSLCGCGREKNNEIAIMAMKQLVDCGTKNIRLTFWGNCGAQRRKQLDELIFRLGLNDYIIFGGKCNKMAEVWASTDIALVCTDAEAFGRVTVEAMAAGALVIAADAASNHELVEDSRGLVFKANNPKDLAEKINLAISNYGEAQTVAKNGSRFANSGEFTLKNYTDKLFKLYSNLDKNV